MITKSRLVEILRSTGVPVNEGISSDKNANLFPRIVFWEYIWDVLDASDTSYETVVTYQVSFHSDETRPEALLKLRKSLHDEGVRPTIYHEFIKESKEIHSYFAIEVMEQLDE